MTDARQNHSAARQGRSRVKPPARLVVSPSTVQRCSLLPSVFRAVRCTHGLLNGLSRSFMRPAVMAFSRPVLSMICSHLSSQITNMCVTGLQPYCQCMVEDNDPITNWSQCVGLLLCLTVNCRLLILSHELQDIF